jgi:autotransporter-associated beta strand protein
VNANFTNALGDATCGSQTDFKCVGARLDVYGVLKDGAGTSSKLIKSGDRTLNITGQWPNTYTGGTTVNGGTLMLGAGGAVGTIRGTLTVNSGATVDYSTSNAFGFNSGQSVNVLNINGGVVGGADFNNHFWNNFQLNLTAGTLYLGGTLNEFYSPTITQHAGHALPEGDADGRPGPPHRRRVHLLQGHGGLPTRFNGPRRPEPPKGCRARPDGA